MMMLGKLFPTTASFPRPIECIHPMVPLVRAWAVLRLQKEHIFVKRPARQERAGRMKCFSATVR